MRYIRGIKIGGLQQKIFNLILVFIIALIAVYAAVSAYQQRNLSSIVQEASTAQQNSIDAVSEETMRAVLEASMSQSTALQAYIADDLFADVRTEVLTLQAFATELFDHAEQFSPHPFYPPDPKNHGIPSVQMQHETGVDPNDSKDFGLVANMSEIMLAMYESSDKLNSCFVATADGCILFADDRAGVYISETGEVYDAFPVRERPWYKQAAEAGELIFTGVELDSFTGIPGLVCAAPVYRDGELVAVVGADIFLTSISDYVRDKASEGGFVCVVSEDGQVLFSPVQEGIFKAGLSKTSPDLRQNENLDLARFVEQSLRERTDLTEIEIEGKAYYLTGAPLGTLGWAVLSAVDKEVTRQPTELMLEQYDEINETASGAYAEGAKHSSQMLVFLTAVILILAVLSALALAGRVVKPLEHMTKRINALSGSDQVFEMEEVYHTGDEIEILAESFASLSERTRNYITQITQITSEKERIGAELSLATRIQYAMMPHIYPAFPDRPEMDIYASMDPAKEVGGDFYDFFLVDDDHLGLVMADVSGKGVPAALFMMASKIILQSCAMLGQPPAEILTKTNQAVCSNNQEEMFVTAWVGVLELSTGKLTAANAGHEYPVLKRADGSFELFRDKHGLVIGAMDGVKYKQYEIQLEPGSKLFLYTDGVPEATNADNKLFGLERMLAALNGNQAAAPEQVLNNVRRAVDEFVQEAEQFDDLTMLCLEYRGKGETSP